MSPGQLGGLICSAPGTLGVLVLRDGSPGVFLLSCSHVLARSGNFGIPFGDVPATQRVVQQPLSATCDPQENRIGLLQDDFSTIRPESAGTTTEDFALAILDSLVAAVTPTGQFAGILRQDPAEWREGMRTVLLGGIHPGASGSIIAYRGENPEYITFPGVGEASFTGLVRYNTACSPGDSGGAVTDDRNQLLGIHIGGDSAQGVGVFLPIASFFTKKNLRLV